jgi:hypothetical protein
MRVEHWWNDTDRECGNRLIKTCPWANLSTAWTDKEDSMVRVQLTARSTMSLYTNIMLSF